MFSFTDSTFSVPCLGSLMASDLPVSLACVRADDRLPLGSLLVSIDVRG